MSEFENNQQQQKAKESFQTPNKNNDRQIEEEILETEKKIARILSSSSYDYYRSQAEERQRALDYEIELLRASKPYVSYADYYPSSYNYSRYYPNSTYPYSPSYYYPYTLRDSHIDYLSGENLKLKDQLYSSEKGLVGEEIENNTLKKDNQLLENELNNQVNLYEDALQKHMSELQLRDQINNDKINNFQNINEQEKKKLNQNIENLKFVNNQNLNEISEQRENNHKINAALNQTEKNLRDASNEAEFWKNKTDEQLIISSAEKEKNNNSIVNLRNYHTSAMINQESQKNQLRNLIAQKESEISITRQSHAKTIAELNFTEIEKRNKEIEAQINKRRAEDIERRKNEELNLRDSIHNAEKNRIIRQSSTEKEVLSSHIRNLSSSVIQKNIEANDWRNNYSRLSSSIRYPSVVRPLFY